MIIQAIKNLIALRYGRTSEYEGALPDTRPEAEKAKDYKAEEIALAGSAQVFQNQKITKLTAKVYSQEQTYSCVPHAFLTQLEYEGIAKEMSQLRAYRKRTNYPGGGSWGPDMYNQIKSGQNPNIEAPVVRGHTEGMANAMPYVLGNKLIKDFKYFSFDDYTKIPSMVSAGKAITIFIYASDNEWSREYVEVRDDVTLYNAYVRHAVTLVPQGDFTENGKQWLSVHDSAAFGGRHLRYISYDFLLRRVYYAAEVVAEGEVPAPQPIQTGNPTTPCKINDRSDNVRNLQAFLIKEKFLEPQYVTGFYGRLTSNAVLWWQLYNHQKFTSNIPELLSLKGEYWGAQSINALQ